jgi:hypothetical protein
MDSSGPFREPYIHNYAAYRSDRYHSGTEA